MAIIQAICSSFKQELMEGVHNFSVGGDVFKIALYGPSANLNSSTTAYAATGEVSGTGYTSGGATLTSLGVAASGTAAYFNFSAVSWPASTIAAAGALIYNTSKSNKAVAVLSFGGTFYSANSTFTLTFPPNTSQTALIIAQ
mgnify:CR=1 FL=1